MHTRIIAVTGMPGSGKGELSTVASELGIKVVALGDVVRSFFFLAHPEGSGDKIGTFANEERSAHGKDIWAKRLIETITRSSEKDRGLLILDGLRSMAEADLLRKELGEWFVVLAIHSSPSARFERLRKRGRSDAPQDLATFAERDKRELSWGIGDVISTADIMLVNEGGLDSFREQVARTLKELGDVH